MRIPYKKENLRKVGIEATFKLKKIQCILKRPWVQKVAIFSSFCKDRMGGGGQSNDLSQGENLDLSLEIIKPIFLSSLEWYCVQVVALLLRGGADPNARDNWSYIPLHEASIKVRIVLYISVYLCTFIFYNDLIEIYIYCTYDLYVNAWFNLCFFH